MMLRSLLFTLSLLSLVNLGVAQYPQCNKTDTAYCNEDSLQSNIIFRCLQSSGSSQPGNCWDNTGSRSAYCWESSPTAGDAKCVKDCTQVTAANGTTFYPLGCSTNNATSSSSGGGPVSTQLPTSSASSSRTSSTTGQVATTTMAMSSSASSATASATGRSDAKSWRLKGSSGMLWYSSACVISIVITNMLVS